MLTGLSPSTLQYTRTKEWQKTAKSNAKKPNYYLALDDSTKEREEASLFKKVGRDRRGCSGSSTKLRFTFLALQALLSDGLHKAE